MTGVWLKWKDMDTVIKARHSDVESALAQAAAEPAKRFIGVFDGPDEGSDKLADVPVPAGVFPDEDE